MKVAKVEVEDNLPEDELENEIKDDLEGEIEDNVRATSTSARGLEHAIDVLSRLASQAAEKQQTRREKALKHAIEVKNEALRKQQERLFELESKRQEKILAAYQKLSDAAKKAKEAAAAYQNAQQELKQLLNESAVPSTNTQK